LAKTLQYCVANPSTLYIIQVLSHLVYVIIIVEGGERDTSWRLDS